ncbi:MAG: adenylyltransferase/cytidyltransferase family protein [Candidatus Brocadiia bacterium]|nr:adenylyltransferase/cytidyltransferase family protein [Planctomycetota bacterium]
MAEIIIDHDVLKSRIDALKQDGQKIVFTNGCFNLLHVGHIRYLQGAADIGNVLLTAINSDDSVRQLKGADYPVVPHDERAEIVAALECVDFVTIFHETDVSNLLLKLKPDVHTKGSDYTLETIPERETVLSYGGELAIAGDPKDHSTTDLIEHVASARGSDEDESE